MKTLTMKTIEIATLKNEMFDLAENQNRRFPGKIAYAIAKNYAAIKSAIKEFEEFQNKLLEKLKEDDELIISDDGKSVAVKTFERGVEFTKEIESAGSVELELSLCTLTQADLDKLLDSSELSVAEIGVIELMLEENKKENEE